MQLSARRGKSSKAAIQGLQQALSASSGSIPGFGRSGSIDAESGRLCAIARAGAGSELPAQAWNGLSACSALTLVALSLEQLSLLVLPHLLAALLDHAAHKFSSCC
jgi:hypothetical protein